MKKIIIINIFKSPEMMTRLIIWNFFVIWKSEFYFELELHDLQVKKGKCQTFFSLNVSVSREKHLTNSVKIDLTDVTDLTIQYMALEFFAQYT